MHYPKEERTAILPKCACSSLDRLDSVIPPSRDSEGIVVSFICSSEDHLSGLKLSKFFEQYAELRNNSYELLNS